MDFVRLTEAQRNAFAADGFLIVRNALDADTVTRLVEETDKLAGAFLRKPEISGKPEYNHLDLRRGLLKEKAMLALVANSRTVPLMVQLLSPNIHLHSTTIILSVRRTLTMCRSAAAGIATSAFRKTWATSSCRSSASRSVTA